MLEGLKSKSSINVVGKKSEKKKLRRKYLEARSEDKIDEHEAEQMYKAEVERFKNEKKFLDGYEFTYTVEEAKKDLIKKDTDDIMGYFQTQGKSEKELTTIREKVSKLGYLHRQQLKTMVAKSIPIDSDLNGLDNDLVKKKQDAYAKTKSPNANWQAYRTVRGVEEFKKVHETPDGTLDKLKKFQDEHMNGDVKRIDKGDIERCINSFMKEVTYTMKDGKKVPATPQDEENLKFNTKFVDSFFSDNKKDWDFRFAEIEKCIDQFSKVIIAKGSVKSGRMSFMQNRN